MIGKKASSWSCQEWWPKRLQRLQRNCAAVSPLYSSQQNASREDEDNNWHQTPWHHAGLRQDRSCTDHSATLHIIFSSLQSSTIRCVSFVNCTSWQCSEGNLLKLLSHYGTPKKIISFIQCSCQGMFCKVVHGGQLSNHSKVKTGVCQGCLLWPFLFTLVAEQIMRISAQGRRRGMQWALWLQLDDLLLLLLLLRSQLYLSESPFWARFLCMWPFYNIAIEVVTFHLHGWCMLGVFMLLASTLSRTWMSGSFESMWWNACVHRLDFDLYSHLIRKSFWEWSQNPWYLQGKNPIYQRLRRVKPAMLCHTGQRTQHTTERAIDWTVDLDFAGDLALLSHSHARILDKTTCLNSVSIGRDRCAHQWCQDKGHEDGVCQ